MSDYDLGRAYGRIEIESEVDSDRASRGLDDVARSADSAGRSLSATEKDLGKLEAMLLRVQHRLSEASDKISQTTRRLGELSAAAVAASISMAGLGNSNMEVAQSLYKAGSAAVDLAGKFRSLRTVSGSLSLASGLLTEGLLRFTGIRKELDALPKWAKGVRAVASGMTAAGVGIGFLAARSAGARMAIAGVASTIAGKLAPAIGFGVTYSRRFGDATDSVVRTVRRARDAMRTYADSTRSVHKAMQGFSRAVAGFAVLKSGVNDLRKFGAMAKKVAVAGIMPLTAAIAALASVKFLPALASGILNISSAVKTLLGSVLILPGAIASLGLIGATLAVGVKGLGGAFKAGFGDAEKFDEAIKDLSPRMQGFARGLQSVKKEYEGFSSLIAEKAFAGFIANFKTLAIGYLPIIKKGMLGVSDGINAASHGLARFLIHRNTVRDIGILFKDASVVSRNFGISLQPALIGLRNMAAVGSGVFARLTGGMASLAFQFRDWSSRVRADGSLERWINNGVEGMRDLWSSIRDASVGIAGFFRVLSGGARSNPLGVLADAAARFRAKMEAISSGDGPSGMFRNLLKVSESVVSKLSAVVQGLGKVFKSLVPFILEFSQSFSEKFVMSIETAATILSFFGKVLSSFDGIFGQIVGTLLGGVVAFKVVVMAIKPLITVFKLLSGSIMMTGMITGINNLSTALSTASQRGGAMGAAMGRASGILSRVGSIAAAAAGGIGAAIAVATIAYGAYASASAATESAQKRIAETSDKAADAQRALGDAIVEAQGKMDPSVYEAVGNSISAMFDKFQAQVDGQIVGNLDKIGLGLSEIFTFGTSDAANNAKAMDAMTRAARDVKDSLSEAGISQKDFNRAVTSGSPQEFLNFLARYDSAVGETSEASNLLRNDLVNQRNEFVLTQAATVNSARGFLDLRSAMETLRDASSSASDKLNAVKEALKAMGYLKTDSIETIKQARDATSQLGEAIAGLGKVDGAGRQMFINGQLNLLNDTVIAMSGPLNTFRDSYAALIELGKTSEADQLMKDFSPQLANMRDQLGMSNDELRVLLEGFGLVPDQIKFLLSMEGVDSATADILALSGYISAMPEGKKLSFLLDSREAADAISKMEGIKATVKEIGDDGRVELKVEVTDPSKVQGGLQGILAQLQADNPNLKIPTVAEIKPPDKAKLDAAVNGKGPVELKVQPKIDPNAPKPKVEGQGPVTPGTKPPETTTTTIKVFAPGVDGTINNVVSKLNLIKDKSFSATIKVFSPGVDGTINNVVSKLNAIRDKSFSATIKVFSPGVDGTISNVRNGLDSLKDAAITIRVHGGSEALGAIGNLKSAIGELIGVAEDMAGKVAAAFDRAKAAADRFKTSLDGVKTQMDTIAAGANASGASLGEGFAQGIESKIDRVRQASLRMAEAAREPLPSSPAKIGPFSGKGWTPFRGRKLAEGFAEGIHAGADSAQQASLSMVSRIVSAMDSVRVAFGVTPTFFDENREVGPGGKKYYRDPNVTEEDLRKARLEKKKQDDKQALLDAEKAADSIPGAKDKIASAQKTLDNAETRLQKAKDSKDADKIKDAQIAFDKAQGNLTKRQNDLKNLEKTAQSGSGSATSGDAKKVDDFVKSMDNAQYGMGAFNESMVDCSAFVSAVANTATGRAAFSERANTTNLRPFLEARGFKEGKGGEGDLSIAWWDNGGGQNGHAALTTGSGLNAESTTGGVRFGEGAAGARSNNGQFTNFMYLPLGGADSKNLERTAGNTADTAKSTEKTIPLIKKADGTYGSSNAAWDHLIQRESGGNFSIVQGVQDANSGGNEASGGFQIAKGTWASHGGKEFAETAGQATPEQQAIIAARIFEKSGGAPWGAGLPGRENEAELRAGLTNTPNSLSGTSTGTSGEGDTLEELRKTNKKLDRAITIAQNPNSSEGEVIRALQDIDDQMATMSETEKQSLESVRSEIMDSRGIKEYDPYENAPKTPKEWFDNIFGGIMQNLLGLYNTVEQGITAAVEAARLISRGLSSTDDVNTMVDGIQSLANTAMQVISTVGSIVQTVGNIAAAAGSAIPGIGQIANVIGSIGGVVGDVNSVIDFAQEVGQIGGRLFGKGLSSLIGFLGGTGELQGQIRTLMDMNDNTIKTWSDRNAADKAVIGMGGPKGGANPNQTGAFRDLNIYQGPGSDPAEMMNNAMFAVAAHSTGVYGS